MSVISNRRSFARTPPTPGRGAREEGYALILCFMITILLTAILMPLLFETQREAQVTMNTRAMRHMELAARQALQEALDVLADDFPEEESSAAQGAQGGIGGIGGMGAQGAATAGGGEGEEEQEPAHDSMNSQSLTYHRRSLRREEGLGLDDRIPDWVIAESANSDSYERDSIRVKSYVYIEDENRKYNLLNLAHPQRELAEQALEQVERLLSWVREDRLDAGLEADFDPRLVARAFQEWMTSDLYRSVDGEIYQRPLLLSNKRKGDENDASDKTTLPISLDELRLAVGDRVRLPASIWIDQLDDEMPPEVHPGLGSLLTVYTALREEPITEDLEGRYIPDEDPAEQGRPSAASARRSAGGEGGAPMVQPPTAAEDAVAMININTAPKAVLLAVAPPDLVPEQVIDEILEYRTKVDDEKVREQEEEQAEQNQFSTGKSRTDVMTGMEGDEAPPLQAFSGLEVLEEKIESFKALDDKAKQEFLKYFGVTSDVFSVHVTVICNPHESADEREASRFLSGSNSDSAEELSRRYLDVKIGEIVRRYRSVVWRRAATEGDEPVEFAAIVPFEERYERKLAFWENPSKVAW